MTIGSRIDRSTHTQAQEVKRAREVDNIFFVIRQEMGQDRTIYGQKLGDARHTFGLMDRDGNGFLSRDEFATGLKRMDFGLTDAQLTEVLDAVDTDGNGTVEYDEFLARLQAGAGGEQVTRLHLEGTAAAGAAKEGSEEQQQLSAKDTQKYFDERHAEAQAKKAARKQEQKKASAQNSRGKTARPKGQANPLLKAKPKERIAQLSQPRGRPGDETDGASGRREPLSPGHVPRHGAPRHRIRRQSPARRSLNHHGRAVAQAVSPDRSSMGNENNQTQTQRDRAAALEAANEALRSSGLSTGATDRRAAAAAKTGGAAAAASAVDAAGAIGLLQERGQGQAGGGWTLDSFS